MFCITTQLFTDTTHYLAWQSPAWDESGYFWTSKDTVANCLVNNTKEHPFLFETREEALAFVVKMHLAQTCLVVKWDGPAGKE